jgi:DNA-binding beta-propeller fold protein YncE
MECAAALTSIKTRVPFALFHAAKHSARLAFLAAVCAVTEGAAVHARATCIGTAVAAVLDDAQRRVCVLGGRPGMPRSLGSVYAGAIVRFLGGCRGVRSRVFETGIASWNNTMALTHDGTMLLIADCFISVPSDRPALTVIRVADGGLVRCVGTGGRGPLQFTTPRQVYIAIDEHVFVADLGNKRVQVLTPTLEFHSFLGVGRLDAPIGVCADAGAVFVSDWDRHCISVFARSDGALLRHFGSFGSRDGQLNEPLSLCIVGRTGNIAVADFKNRRVCIFSVDGAFVRHLGVGKSPTGIAGSHAGDEIAVTYQNALSSIAMFDAGGELLRTLECWPGFSGASIHDGAVYAHTANGACAVFT